MLILIGKLKITFQLKNRINLTSLQGAFEHCRIKKTVVYTQVYSQRSSIVVQDTMVCFCDLLSTILGTETDSYARRSLRPALSIDI